MSFSATSGISLIAHAPPGDPEPPALAWGGGDGHTEGGASSANGAHAHTRPGKFTLQSWHKFSDTAADQCFWGARAQGRGDYLGLLPVKMALPLLGIHLEAFFVGKPVHQHR